MGTTEVLENREAMRKEAASLRAALPRKYQEYCDAYHEYKAIENDLRDMRNLIDALEEKIGS